MIELLQGDTITLKRVGTADAPDIFQAVRESIEHLSPWLPWCHAEYSIQETESFVENYQSQRVAERAGAICEGILRSRLWLRDRFQDAVCYSIIPLDAGH